MAQVMLSVLGACSSRTEPAVRTYDVLVGDSYMAVPDSFAVRFNGGDGILELTGPRMMRGSTVVRDDTPPGSIYVGSSDTLRKSLGSRAIPLLGSPESETIGQVSVTRWPASIHPLLPDRHVALLKYGDMEIVVVSADTQLARILAESINDNRLPASEDSSEVTDDAQAPQEVTVRIPSAARANLTVAILVETGRLSTRFANGVQRGLVFNTEPEIGTFWQQCGVHKGDMLVAVERAGSSLQTMSDEDDLLAAITGTGSVILTIEANTGATRRIRVETP